MGKKEIYWHLPGICYFGMINHVLFDAMKKYPDMFVEGYKIGSVYGTFPSAIWNGGRTMLSGFSRRHEVENIIKAYNAAGVPVRFTWTNVLLEEEHVHDTYCNMIMDVGNNGFNQVLVNSPALEKHIRENYPKYKVLSSTTKRILNIEKLKEELLKDYYLVVLDYDLNHNEMFLDMLEPFADKIEILVNETCQPHCPDRVRHYQEISRHQLEFDSSIQFKCTDPNPNKRTFEGIMNCPSFISKEGINDYIERGFKNFKIVGRGEGQEFYIDSLIYYLVKDENKPFIRKYINETLNMLRSASGRNR